MPWNGSGTFTRSSGSDTGAAIWAHEEAAASNMSATRIDYHDQDIATALNNCVCKDGQNAATADLPMGTHKHTGVTDGTALTHYASMKNLQNSTAQYGATSGGSANTQTLTLSPAPTALVAGQVFYFYAGYTNTGATTLNVNSLGAVAVANYQTLSSLNGGEIQATGLYQVVYAAGGFYLMNPSTVGIAAAFQFPFSTSYAAVSAAGSNRATATPITKTYTAVTGGTGGVSLPDAVAGRNVWIVNGTGSPVYLFCYDASDTMNTAVDSVSVALQGGEGAHFLCVQTGAWFRVG
jgi:hypothetical protein